MFYSYLLLLVQAGELLLLLALTGVATLVARVFGVRRLFVQGLLCGSYGYGCLCVLFLGTHWPLTDWRSQQGVRRVGMAGCFFAIRRKRAAS